MTLLSAQELSVQFGERVLFSGLSIALETSELVGVAGPSGAGKTSLLRAMAGLITASKGRFELEGKTPDEIGWPAYRRQVCFVHRTPQLRSLGVRESLMQPFELATSTHPYDADEAERLLDALGIGDKIADNAKTLSAGEQQRVALVRALLVRPRVLLLDEPTSALDPKSKAAAEAVITEHVQKVGGAALIVSHEDEQRRRWCARTIMLGAGP